MLWTRITIRYFPEPPEKFTESRMLDALFGLIQQDFHAIAALDRSNIITLQNITELALVVLSICFEAAVSSYHF